jgi:CRISPR-associated protein Cas1
MIGDLRLLPKTKDSWSHLYVERCRIDQDQKAVVVQDATGRVRVPCAQLSVLMLGPGVNITHAAIRTLADHGCSVVWTGEHGVRFYASGLGESRSAANLIRQARLVSDPVARLRVVRRMYETRFGEPIDRGLTIQQIRGREGARVRDTYRRLSADTGVAWEGRRYRRDDWAGADHVNRALSAANSCLYSVCHAAVVSAGYSPGLGFIHTGKVLSFVYDVADLYKTQTSIPAAFRAVASGELPVERAVRRMMREQFHSTRLLARVVSDLGRITEQPDGADDPHAAEPAAPGELWDPEGPVPGGANFAPH